MFDQLRTTKNLLAFSAGVDSTALFFLLLEHNVAFDIAIVHYGRRPQADLEVAYAKTLAKKYDKTLHFHRAENLAQGNFEMQARKIRYDFFEKLIKSNGYEVLLTGHQLNDVFEWFLMQLAKGAGIDTLISMHAVSKRDGYHIHRPLLHKTKQELLDYLHRHNHHYFIDDSNADEKIARNFIRHNFSDPFLSYFAKGVNRSFDYLRNDQKKREPKIELVCHIDECEVFSVDSQDGAIKVIDSYCKHRNLVISAATKKEILKQKQITISGTFCIAYVGDLVWIAPKAILVMDKAFKECCRNYKIPQNIRPYLKKILGECNEIKRFISRFHAGNYLSLDK